MWKYPEVPKKLKRITKLLKKSKKWQITEKLESISKLPRTLRKSQSFWEIRKTHGYRETRGNHNIIEELERKTKLLRNSRELSVIKKLKTIAKLSTNLRESRCH